MRSLSSAVSAQWNRRVPPAVALEKMSVSSPRQVHVELSTWPSTGSKQQGG